MRRAWDPVFFEALRRTRDVSRSARIAGVSRALVYQYYDSHEDFASQWNAALDAFDAAQLQRAMDRLRSELGPA